MSTRRIAIFGNSGSGKSTLARKLSAELGVPMLELDTIVWEPGKIAVERPRATVLADLNTFIESNDEWVVEGCYGDILESTLEKCTEIYFLNPGADACSANNRRRPWEPHKYDSPEAQDAMLENLIGWVRGYYTRDDGWSLAAHRRLFDSFKGRKTEVGS